MARGKKRRSTAVGASETAQDTDDVYDEVDQLHNSLNDDLDVEPTRRRRTTQQHELMPIVHELSDSEVYEQEEEERETPLPSANEWGRKRKLFYVDSSTKVREDGLLNDEEQEALELEEEDAIRRQQRADLSHSLVNMQKLSALVEQSDDESEVQKPPKQAAVPIKTLGQLRRQVQSVVEEPIRPTAKVTPKQVDENFVEGWDDVPTDKEEHREINYEIEKNKGIKLKRRKKGTEHSRVKRRLQYQRALVKRRSQVPDVKRETSKYTGEARGIRASTVRSVPLK